MIKIQYSRTRKCNNSVQQEHKQRNKDSFLYSQQLFGYPKAKKKENAKVEEETI